ncbi:MAG: mechanosensitive ion channel family protein [Rubrivivax sp.]|nr:mechanosensitive ion channel family protein [Rubrivivax sp.]
MEDLTAILEHVILGNTLREWGLAALAFAFTFVVVPAVRGIAARRQRARTAEYARLGKPMPAGIHFVARLVASTSRLFLLTLALWFATRILTLPAKLDHAFTLVIVLTFWLQVAIWGVAAARVSLDRQLHKGGPADAARAGSFEVLLFVTSVAIYSFALLLALDNLGVQIKPLLAGLGIGGIAIALAVQTVLGDLFASLSITLDKPFEIGDALVVDDVSGTVERIGIKSTRLRGLGGEQIIISNADLLKSRVRNFKRMRERRYAFNIGVTCETPRARLAEIPAIVEAIVRAQPKTRFDRCHLLRFGDWSLNFEAVYFVTEPDYLVFANAQQAINLALLEEFARRGIGLAYPTQRQVIDAPAAVSGPS